MSSANQVTRANIGVYPQNINTREKRVVEAVIGNPSLQVKSIAATGADYAVLDRDGYATFVVNDAVTITLPEAAANEGRRLLFIQKGTAVLTIAQNADAADIAGANSDYVSADAAGDRVELVSDGTEWLVVSSTIA